VVGTAGHIDHGKTALCRALTGIDTDRLPEEKTRGITIELGFAHLTTASGGRIAVIDVPGHERFVRTMVAGASGIDLVLLVIAADEGVMPQTREHLDICALLGISRGLIALTKIDLVDPEWLALVSDEVRAAVEGTFLASAPIVPCSATAGTGVPALRAALETMAATVAARAGARSVEGPLRLPLDRVFTVKGFGTVVTGTLASGCLREGDDTRVLPARSDGQSGGNDSGHARTIQVHGEARAQAQAGERTAVNLPAIARADLERGAVLVHPGEMQAGAIIDVELTVLPVCPRALGNRTKLLFHALTTQENASLVLYERQPIPPGGRGLAQIHLQRPVALLPGDRFILRGFRALPQHGATIAGGRVVRILGPRRRRPRPGLDDPALARLRQMVEATTPDQRIALEIEAAGVQGLDRVALRARAGEGTRRIERAMTGLLARRAAITFHRDSGGVVSAAALASVEQAITTEVDRFHAAHPLAPGIAREAARTARPFTRALDPRIFALAVTELARRGVIETDADLLRRKDFSPAQAEAQKDLWIARVRALYRDGGLSPPSRHEVAARAAMPAAEAHAAIEILIRHGELVRVKADLCFDRAAIEILADRLRQHLSARGAITPQEWKQLTGQTRKYAIPLAEHFDDTKLTLRIGDLRRLRGG
jgi:selenocysteine-specific elongation factor